MGNAACCHHYPSFAEITNDNFVDHTYFLNRLENVHRDTSRSLGKLKQDLITVDLSEWSTTERVAKIQEIRGSNLRLLVKNSEILNEITISPKGLEPPKRPIRDGVVYFGFKTKDDQMNVVVDYKFKASKEISEKYIGPHFMIYFDINDFAYYLHDLAIGFGTFLKINESMILENDYLINIGNTFILINVIPRYESDTFPKLKLKIFGADSLSEVYFFHAQEFYMASIVIGRSKRCQVYVRDYMISKQHASIFFTSDKNWVIVDGTITKNSLNGTWLYVNHDVRLAPNMEFKACDSIFKVIS